MSGAGERGFTLFEMLVVLAVLGLISGLVWPSLGAGIRTQARRGAGAQAAAMLRAARAGAIRTGVPSGMAGVGFFGDGSSTGGTVEAGGVRYAVSATGIARPVAR